MEGSIGVLSTKKLISSSVCMELDLLKSKDLHFLAFRERSLSLIQLKTTATELRVLCTICAFILLK